MTIIYEKHPVSKERKAELRQMGYKIVDAKFAPKDYVYPFGSKSETPATEYDDMTAEELHALAKERGVKVHANAGKEKVIEALTKGD